MPTLRAWDQYPETYRAEEMELLARWILAGESGSVIGLSGCGRSNLLNFLCYRPDALQRYLPPAVKPIAVVPVDFNHLPASDSTTLYLVILRAIYWVRHHFPTHLHETITTTYQAHQATQSPFLAQSALHELLFTLQAENIQVVLVFNHFDRFVKVTRPQTLDTLRGLRDSFRDTVCFIAGMAQKAVYLPDPETFEDLFSGILLYQVCWVGAMNEDDARWVIQQQTYTAPQPPDETETRVMLNLTGGFPALLRAVGLWWLNCSAKPPLTQWSSVLVNDPTILFQLTKLWRGLTQEEQYALTRIGRKRQSQLKKGATVSTLSQETIATLHHLAEKGLCYQAQNGWRVRGDLLAVYITQVGPDSRGRIRMDEVTGMIFQGEEQLPPLPPQEDILLRFFIKHPKTPHSYTRLIEVVWGAEAVDDQTGVQYFGRDKEDLHPLIMKLRRKIQDDSVNPRYLINFKTKPEGGYQFFPEGQPGG